MARYATILSMLVVGKNGNVSSDSVALRKVYFVF